jgi:hypothetical protein
MFVSARVYHAYPFNVMRMYFSCSLHAFASIVGLSEKAAQHRQRVGSSRQPLGIACSDLDLVYTCISDKYDR